MTTSLVAPEIGRFSPRLRRAVIGVAAGWVLFMAVMLLRSSVPDLGPRMRFGRGPTGHLAMAAVLGFLLTTVLLLVERWKPPVVAWYATVGTAVMVTVLEIAQIPVPVRAFELDDLVYGVAGGVVGAGAATAAAVAIGRGWLMRLVVVVGLLGLVLGVGVAVIRDPAIVALMADTADAPSG